MGIAKDNWIAIYWPINFVIIEIKFLFVLFVPDDDDDNK